MTDHDLARQMRRAAAAAGRVPGTSPADARWVAFAIVVRFHGLDRATAARVVEILRAAEGGAW